VTAHPPEPRAVSAFEADLLTILWFFLRREPQRNALPRILAARERPPCLSRAAVLLVQDALAKGCVLVLCRGPHWQHEGNGWMTERYLREGLPREGRLWERSDPHEMGLRFSKGTLEFLMWVTAEKADDPKARGPDLAEKSLTPADWLLLYLAYTALRQTPLAPAIRAWPVFVRNPLCRLAYPTDFPRATKPIDFAPWTKSLAGCILEGLQSELTAAWVEAEAKKGQTSPWQELQEAGRAQERELDSFLTVLETADRRDLARFLLRALQAGVTEDVKAVRWVAGLQSAGTRLADRAETYHCALTVVRQLDRFRRWAAAARGVGYFDEGYAAAQLWLADWEQSQGEELARRGQALQRQLEPLSSAKEPS
jgi:hypothetical protein